MSAAVLGVGLVATGCSAVKVGSAAIVGNQRITVATLDTEVTNLSENVKQYHNPGSLTVVQQTQDPLTWLIRFQINEQLARQAGITVSPGAAQAAWAAIYAEAKANAASQGVANASQNLILVNAGIPPNLYTDVQRYAAIDNLYEAMVNGGKAPTTQSASNAAGAKLARAQCLAAKSLKIQVNPQFGRLNYTSYEVVPAASTVTRAQGPAKAASLAGLAPAC